MKPLRRNGLKGHQHLAQGIALGRKTNIIFALNQRSTAEGKVKGQKPYLFHYAFAQRYPGRCPGLEAYKPFRLYSGTSET